MIPRNVLFERAWHHLAPEHQAAMLSDAAAYFESTCVEDALWQTESGAILLKEEDKRYKTVGKGHVVQFHQRDHVVMRVECETQVTNDAHKLPLRRTTIFTVMPTK